MQADGRLCCVATLPMPAADVQAPKGALWLRPPVPWAAWHRCCTWSPAGCRRLQCRHGP